MTKKAKEQVAAVDSHAAVEEGEDTDDEVYDVKRIAGRKLEDGVEYYLVEWDGYGDEDNTWEETHNVLCKGEIVKFQKKYQKQFKALGWKPPPVTGRNYKQVLHNAFDPDVGAYFSLHTWYASKANCLKKHSPDYPSKYLKSKKTPTKRFKGGRETSPMVLSDSDDQPDYVSISSESSPERLNGTMTLTTTTTTNHIMSNSRMISAVSKTVSSTSKVNSDLHAASDYSLVRVATKRGRYVNSPPTVYIFKNLTPSVTVVNDIDDEHYPNFTYITDLKYINVSLPSPEFLDGCSCAEQPMSNSNREGKGNSALAMKKTRSSSNKPFFCCTANDGMKCHDDDYYNDNGTLFDPSHRVIRECNVNCSCYDTTNSRCKNRVVTQGRQYPMIIYKTKEKGWGVRCPVMIPRGAFIEEYVGEVITAEESSKRAKHYSELEKSYLFAMDITANYREHTNVVDASSKGNVSRFFNHSCNPNSAVYAVFSDSADELLHRLAFFAVRDILPNTEICFDYTGGQGATIKNGAVCHCNEDNCKGFF